LFTPAVIYGLEPEDGMDPPSQAVIEAAATQANAHGFITSFPEAYETGAQRTSSNWFKRI